MTEIVKIACGDGTPLASELKAALWTVKFLKLTDIQENDCFLGTRLPSQHEGFVEVDPALIHWVHRSRIT